MWRVIEGHEEVLVLLVHQVEEKVFDGGARILDPLAKHAVARIEQDAEADWDSLGGELRDLLQITVLVDLEHVLRQAGNEVSLRVAHRGDNARELDARAKQLTVLDDLISGNKAGACHRCYQDQNSQTLAHDTILRHLLGRDPPRMPPGARLENLVRSWRWRSSARLVPRSSQRSGRVATHSSTAPRWATSSHPLARSPTGRSSQTAGTTSRSTPTWRTAAATDDVAMQLILRRRRRWNAHRISRTFRRSITIRSTAASLAGS